MAGALTLERVRRDVDVLAHAGLDLPTFVAELDLSLQRAVPYSAACFALVDPATMLLTATYKTGDLLGKDGLDFEWGLVEYGEPEPTSFLELATHGVDAAGVHVETAGEPDRSPRLSGFIRPHFDYHDEVRVMARADDRVWGGIALFSDDVQGAFTPAEIEFLGSLGTGLALGFRAGVLATLATTAPPLPDVGPAVLVVGADDTIRQMSIGAAERLEQLPHTVGGQASEPHGVVAALVAGARRYAQGLAPTLPRSRVRVASGQWYVLHASPLSGGTSGESGDVVVTIEQARPPEIVPLVVAAFGLTPRERDVTQLVLQGVDTKEIAATLHLSAYTVQDHLKSVFEKADVRSRRELIARVFFDQYAPRLGSDIAPSHWFAD